MKASHVLACALALAATPAAARVVEDEQVWLNATVTGFVPNTDIAYFAEIQPRFVDQLGRTGSVILRPAIGWRVTPAFIGYVGYASIISPVENARDGREDRLFLQASWTLGDLAGGSLSSRTRLERRRLSNGGDTGWRVRELLRWVRPLGNPRRTRALLSVEPFVALNATDWGANDGFDQLRSFVGVEVPIGERSTLELGYLNQAINDPGRRIRMNHVASLAIFIRP